MPWRGWIVGVLLVGLTMVMWSTGLPAATPTSAGTLTIAVPDEPPGLDPTTSPGAAIALAVLGCNLLGDGLRDLLDPKVSRPR
jgi:ABC-type transport system substrate-binding protein